jgi:hypothetical protein
LGQEARRGPIAAKRRCVGEQPAQIAVVEVRMVQLAALLLLFAIVGGVAISKFLFFVLIIAAILALIGFFKRPDVPFFAPSRRGRWDV